MPKTESNTTDTQDLSAAIQEFERALPGWWWTAGRCMLTRDASCGPDRQGPDAHLLRLKEARQFDEGFHADLADGTVADALRDVMMQALAARRIYVKD